MRTAIPVIKVYIRVKNGPLFCINDSIQLEQEIARLVISVTFQFA